jgi:hypothetical protein
MKLPGGDVDLAGSGDAVLSGLETLCADQQVEIDGLARLLGAVYPYIGFPFDPDKARLAWQEFARLMLQVEATLERYPGTKVLELDPGNVRDLPPGRRPRRQRP